MQSLVGSVVQGFKLVSGINGLFKLSISKTLYMDTFLLYLNLRVLNLPALALECHKVLNEFHKIWSDMVGLDHPGNLCLEIYVSAGFISN